MAGGPGFQNRPGARWQLVFQFRANDNHSPNHLYPAKEVADVLKWPSAGALLAYAGEYRFGIDGLFNPKFQDRDGFFVAHFWAYDATAGLCWEQKFGLTDFKVEEVREG